MLTATCTNANGLLAARFFLGIAEAAIAPGLTIIISMFYKRSEQPLRQGAWFLGTTCAGLFGGLINYGIGHINSIAPWKAVFLILGAVTIVWALCTILLLPDTPSNAWFLTTSDRAKAVTRVQENLTGVKSDHFNWAQCREAFADMKTWFLVLIQVGANIPNGGVSAVRFPSLMPNCAWRQLAFGQDLIGLQFRPTIINGLGFSTFDTLLLQCVPYLVQFTVILVTSGGSTYFRNTRTYWMMAAFAIALLGASLVRELPADHKWGRYAGTCLMGAFSAVIPLLLSMVSGNIGGFTKKTTVTSLSFIAYCAGNIIGPQLFFESEAPSYRSGFIALMNRIRDNQGEHAAAAEPSETEIEMMAMMDKTDKEIVQFRYVY
ncbi:Major facilitator superfamily transporter [Penicillium chermesinum]|uniref:Major facilitator superfamily transporter n=1 Tax=Penicillium chermesinum TaxID=63820 RepID=A0A9W9NGG9_9EURO|nr:Major facilitator superfamily transporter [Penicillium chermesinum]KAJ5219524.1 Major facilitator superfamily transporter [Penicillium chermesinum]KAJ6153544.1 Major facilitator superfamily transporter [Penicillium chermesinum]